MVEVLCTPEPGRLIRSSGVADSGRALSDLVHAHTRAVELLGRRGGRLSVSTTDIDGYQARPRAGVELRAQAMATFAALPGQCLVAHSEPYTLADLDPDQWSVRAMQASVEAIDGVLAQLRLHPAEVGDRDG